MTSEGLAFSEFGESAFCVYLSGSQERAGRSLGLVSSRPRLQWPVLGTSGGLIPMNGGDGGKEERELKMPFVLSLKHQFTKLWLQCS